MAFIQAHKICFYHHCHHPDVWSEVICYVSYRTNVVQSMLARISLRHQLQEMGVLSEHERVEDHVSFESTFKNGLLSEH